MKKNSAKPKISIIISITKESGFITQSIDSIFKQSLKELEVLCICNHSSNEILKVLKNYNTKDERIKIFFQENLTIGSIKNFGIEQSTGEFIAFLNAGDYYIDENALSKLYINAKEKGINICGGFGNKKSNNEKIEPMMLHRAFLVGFPNGRMFSYKYLQYDRYIQTFIFNRKMLQTNDIKFTDANEYYEAIFFIKAMMVAQKFYVVPTEMYCYKLQNQMFNETKCHNIINGLKKQLEYTSTNRLNICHYIAMQRVNYEYGPLFENYIKSGDFKLLELMLETQKCINNELIDKTINNKIDKDILNFMCVPDYKVEKKDINGKKEYILIPLYNFINKNINLNEQIEEIYNSKTYKTGKVILWFPKKILKIFNLLKK